MRHGADLASESTWPSNDATLRGPDRTTGEIDRWERACVRWLRRQATTGKASGVGAAVLSPSLVLRAACILLAMSLQVVAQEPPGADSLGRAAGGEIDPPPAMVRYWPHGQEIRLGYRLIGDYAMLRQRLRDSEPLGLGANWEPAFDVIAGVDVERHLLHRIGHFAELTGLSMIAEPYDPSRSPPFDICIEIYLSDRVEDLVSFSCLEEMDERLSSEPLQTEAFVTWGLATTYGTETSIRGAGCFATYSAFTFREEIGRDSHYPSVTILRPQDSGMWAPFRPLSGQTFAGPIVGHQLGLFGRLREMSGRTERRDNTWTCRRRLREAYHRQIDRIIDNCMVTMLGVPVSDVGPSHEPVGLSTLLGSSRLSPGSPRWVSAVGVANTRHYQETPRLRLLEQRDEDLLTSLYSSSMTLEELEEFAATDVEPDVAALLDANEVPPWANLFKVIEDACLGRQ